MPTKPTQLRIPPELLEQIDQRAKEAGITRTAWLIEAAKDRLAKDPYHGGEIEDLVRDMNTLREAKRENEAIVLNEILPAPRYRCSKDCDPNWRPTSPTLRCPFCRSVSVPA